jgi:hypothetical protein
MLVQPARTRWALFLVLAWQFADFCSTAAADGYGADAAIVHSDADPELNDLLQTLDARRTLAGEGGYRWSFTSERLTVPMPGGEDYQAALERRALHPLAEATKDEKEQFEGQVMWQPSTNRFLFSASFVYKWIGGAADYLGEREQIGFDGQAFWDYETVRPGTELPQEDFTQVRDADVDWRPSGTISTQIPPGGRIEHLAAESGYIFRPGYMALPYGHNWGSSVEIAGFLRELARGGKTITMQKDGELVHVSFLAEDNQTQPEQRGTMRLTFNMAQLAAIERITYFGDGPGGKRYQTADYSIRNTEVSPGVWFPQEIIWGNWMNSLVTRVQISDVRIVESFRTADFQVEFPLGTHISDHRNNTFLIASDDVWDESRATQEYAARYLGGFSATVADTGSGKTVLFWAIVVINTIIVLVGLSYFGRRWGKKRAARVLIVTALLNASAWAGDPPKGTPLNWSERGWVLQSGNDGRETVVAQCGYRAACLALTAFKREYEPVQLARQLRPTTGGMTLRQIVEALQGFRIRIDVRSHVSWQELSDSLPEGVFALIAIPPHRIVGGHFVGAIRNSNKEVIVLDPPFKTTVLRPRNNEHYTSQELVVAFLTEPRPDDAACDASQVELPSRVEVSPDPDGWTKPVLTKFSITNRSSVPIWLEKIKPGCGCIKVLNQPALLLPETPGIVEIEINPLAWGVGLRQRAIPLSFFGQFQASIVLEAEFVTLSAAEPNPATGVKTVPVPLEWGEEPFQREVRVPLTALPQKARAEVKGGNGWCDASVDKDGPALTFNVNIVTPLLERIRSGETLSCRIELTGPALYGTFQLHVVQDLSALTIDERDVRVDEGRFRIAGRLLSGAPGGWRGELKSPSRLPSSSTWEVSPEGHWQVQGELLEQLTRATPVTLRFSHPEFMSVSTVCVLRP